MEFSLKNFTISFKGINLFGIIITTKNQISNAKMEADTIEYLDDKEKKCGVVLK